MIRPMNPCTSPRLSSHLLALVMGDPVVGKRIQQARKEAGLTQRALAERIGLQDSQSVSNYERGGSDVPRDRLKRIAEATG